MYQAITSSSQVARTALRVHLVASDDLARDLKRFGAPAGFLGENGEFLFVNASTALLGIGKRDAVTNATARTAGAKLVRALDRAEVRETSIELSDHALADHVDRVAIGAALAEGMGMARWRIESFIGTASSRKTSEGRLRITSSDRDVSSGLERGLQMAESINYARQLSATPPNICSPQWIASEARRLAKSHRLSCRVINYAEAKRLGMGGLVAVGMGSEAKPCLTILEWRPKKVARAAKDVHLCLVGKTVTYDTGGYSLKVNNGMKGMKYDKCGGTAVLGAMHAIAQAALPVRVTALLPAAENMVSSDSYRPDDIITHYNGVTVEVTNTDAEGRLILADALAYASKTMRPTHILDMATLTGGVVVALGSWCAGVMCNDSDLLGRVERSGEATGDRVWRLPLWNEHREHMRSQHADIINSNPSRLGHPLQGGAFLSFFVDEKIPWAHIDIAGVASVESANDLCSIPGPTGYGVRLLFDVARGFTT